jgi:hypothetical protein
MTTAHSRVIPIPADGRRARQRLDHAAHQPAPTGTKAVLTIMRGTEQRSIPVTVRSGS